MKSLLLADASTGFGRNVALAMARLGWRVFATICDPAKGASLFAEWQREARDGDDVFRTALLCHKPSAALPGMSPVDFTCYLASQKIAFSWSNVLIHK